MGEKTTTFRSRREERFYHKLRSKLRRWAQVRRIPEKQLEYVLAAPDLFVLLSRLALDPRVSARAKAKAATGLVYFLSPVDLVPDFLGPVGFLDDVVVAAYLIYTICEELNILDPSILQEHWEGEGEALQRVTDIVAQAEDVLGKGLRFVIYGVRGLRPGGNGPGRESL